MPAPLDNAADPPTWPPRTPPPKRPVTPQPPDDVDAGPVAGHVVPVTRRGVSVRDRRGTNRRPESAPWAPKKARSVLLERLAAWDYRLADASREAVEAVARLLAGSAVGEGGTRISLRPSDQEGAACIVALSHRPGPTSGHEEGGDDVLHRVTGYRQVTGCGTDSGPDGRRVRAVVDL